jgi:hypothetical protein
MACGGMEERREGAMLHVAWLLSGACRMLRVAHCVVACSAEVGKHDEKEQTRLISPITFSFTKHTGPVHALDCRRVCAKPYTLQTTWHVRAVRCAGNGHVAAAAL